jgi:UDP-3-O-[3-hydroxymyristoyl] glucosamine N-acyltransferase
VQLTFQEILKISHGQVANPVSLPGNYVISKIAALGQGKATDLCFFVSKAFFSMLANSHPAVLVTSRPLLPFLEKTHLWKTCCLVVTENPYLAMAALSEQFALLSSRFPDFDPIALKNEVTWVHPSAVVAPDAVLGVGVTIGPHAVVSAGVKIGDHCLIGMGSFVGHNCVIGDATLLFPRVVLYPNTKVGSRVRLHAGAVIGADGFGYTPRMEGKRPLGHYKIYHTGHVVIENDVEIGANSCVDRGTFGETRIDESAKIDNLVQIGHNVHIKKGAILCGHVGISGSVTVGEYAVVGGAAGIADHVHIGDHAQVGGMTLVTKDVAPAGKVVGNPQREFMQHFKIHAYLNKMAKQGFENDTPST